ncbi:uncharacterized protein LOC107418485 [Ziziphus jujuba]|uniref:Uncharacterized protein LOC107418485 n=1 Tax=Ziziphus jujuba TaxID=326968 RepID=A0ABM4A2J9_ZIZJJ|nr:uncharacterized protein LOC107418485 [Ziziphus jujuba]
MISDSEHCECVVIPTKFSFGIWRKLQLRILWNTNFLSFSLLPPYIYFQLHYYFPIMDRNVVEPCKNQDNRIEIRRKSSESLAEEKLTQCNSQTPQQDKLPPLVNALKTKAEQNVASFHFPGHNRALAAPSSLTRLIGVEPFVHDLPNTLPELDNLFCPEGPILDAQQQAAKLFGSSETWFLVGGTTCGIQAAIMATCSPGDILILPRNSHISAISAMIFSGAVPKYIIPDYNSNWDIAAGVTPSQASLINCNSHGYSARNFSY